MIRGGAVGALNASVVDTLRIGKFLTDFPKGPLFIVKQVGLQLSNPILETKKITIGDGRGILGFIGNTLSKLNNTLGPTRIYNLGFNTIAQIPVNAFGGHFNRHGLLPVQDENTKYLAVVQANNIGFGSNNRLIGYKNKFQLGDLKTNTTQNRSILGLLNTITGALSAIGLKIPPVKFNPTQLTINQYAGGPGSVYGIGKTILRRYDFTEDGAKIRFSYEQSKAIAGKARNVNDNNVGALNRSVDLALTGPTRQAVGRVALPTNPSLQTYANIKAKVDKQSKNSVFAYNPVKNTSLGSLGLGDLYNGVISNYTNGSIQYRNGIDRKPVTVKGTWRTANREVRVGSGRQDIINLTPIFSAKAGTLGDSIKIGNTSYNINDLVKFRIQSLNGDDPTNADWMIFRAYLTQFSDNTDATWNSVKYAGRGEDFYVYNGFSRKIQIGFKVAALSEKEMEPMYQKLNYLMGNVMPDYKDSLMRGPIIKMTVGNWIDGQDGILNSVSYTIPQDSPWEIAINEPVTGEKRLILPHVVEVALTFTPIGSQTRGKNLISRKSYDTSHIAQNVNEASTNQYISGSIQQGVSSFNLPSNFNIR